MREHDEDAGHRRIQQANSGHPGTPMGSPHVYCLWQRLSEVDRKILFG